MLVVCVDLCVGCSERCSLPAVTVDSLSHCSSLHERTLTVWGKGGGAPSVLTQQCVVVELFSALDFGFIYECCDVIECLCMAVLFCLYSWQSYLSYGC